MVCGINAMWYLYSVAFMPSVIYTEWCKKPFMLSAFMLIVERLSVKMLSIVVLRVVVSSYDGLYHTI
jgi:hypothetical protein